MTPQEIMNGMAEKNRMLTMKNDELVELYKEYAEAEREYNIKYAHKLTSLRIDGESITLAKELAKGDKIIAELFYKMRIAEGVLNACREKIKDLRSSIDTYRSLLSWLKAEFEVSRQ
jgi:hypothetical protein